MTADRDTANPTFAGDLFLTLAAEGRLVLKTRDADRIIAGLERTLSEVRDRLRTIEELHRGRGRILAGRAIARTTVDAQFVEQVAPGRLEEAAVELPKYIEAIRLAGRNGSEGNRKVL